MKPDYPKNVIIKGIPLIEFNSKMPRMSIAKKLLAEGIEDAPVVAAVYGDIQFMTVSAMVFFEDIPEEVRDDLTIGCVIVDFGKKEDAAT